MKIFLFFLLVTAGGDNMQKVYFNNGMSAYNKKDYKKALTEFKTSLKYSKHSLTYAYLSYSYYALKDRDSAVIYGDSARFSQPILPEKHNKCVSNICNSKSKVQQYTQINEIYKARSDGDFYNITFMGVPGERMKRKDIIMLKAVHFGNVVFNRKNRPSAFKLKIPRSETDSI